MNQRINGLAIFGFLCLIWSTTGPVCIPAEAQAGEAESILKKLSGSKGICAVLGDPKAELTLQLARKSEFICYIQLRNGADVLAAREAADLGASRLDRTNPVRSARGVARSRVNHPCPNES